MGLDRVFIDEAAPARVPERQIVQSIYTLDDHHIRTPRFRALAIERAEFEFYRRWPGSTITEQGWVDVPGCPYTHYTVRGDLYG